MTHRTPSRIRLLLVATVITVLLRPIITRIEAHWSRIAVRILKKAWNGILEMTSSFRRNVYILGALSLAWLLLRSGTRPDRLRYPCQQAALAQTSLAFPPLAVALVTPAGKWKKGLEIFSRVAVVLGVVVFGVLATTQLFQRTSLAPSPSHAALGVTDAAPPKVIRIQDTRATNWDFTSQYYWQHVDQGIVNVMVEEGMKQMTGQSTEAAAWSSVMTGYDPGEVVALKINCNDCWNTDQNEIGALPQVINAVIKGLKSMGILEQNIHVVEPTEGGLPRQRILYQYYFDMIHALYPNAPILDGNDSTYLTGGSAAQVTYTTDGRTDRISDLLVQADHLINLPIMKAIRTDWGISGAIKNHQGSIRYPIRNHAALIQTTNNPLVDIYNNTNILNKTRLIIGDGLFGTWTGIHFFGPGEHDDVPYRWLTFNNGAPNSLFFAQDPVAVDSVMQDIIQAERTTRNRPGLNDPILVAAANAGLGVHEHGTLAPGASSPDFTYAAIAYASRDTSTDPSCTPSWQCGSWSSCVNGTQTRSCNDTNQCGTTEGQPPLSQTCTVQCTPVWQCDSWSTCTNNSQTRSCTDQNNCGTTDGRPPLSQSCVPVCTPDWQCSPWSTCTDGTQARVCQDSNSCGINNQRPPETQTCTPVCSPNWQCTPWGPCLNGVRNLDCQDQNQCGVPVPISLTTQSCDADSPAAVTDLTAS